MGERILKEGYLMKAPDALKYLHTPKKWQRKWFTLDHSGDLNFYDSDKSSRPSGVLHVRQSSLLFDPKITKAIQHSFVLGLEFRDHSAYLKAESALSFNEWLRNFRDFAEKCDLEELPESQGRHSTLLGSDQFGARMGSVSSVLSQSLASSNTRLKLLRRKEGLMAKTGSNNKGWKDRYFILAQEKLSYYKNEKSVSSDGPLGYVNMLDCSSATKTTGKKGYGFDLHTPSRVFNFSVESEADLRDWMEDVSHTIEILSGSRGISPVRIGGEQEKRLSTSSDISGASLDKILERTEQQKEKAGSPARSSQEGLLDNSGKSEDKDSVMQLLEAEVEALRSKVSSLEADLHSSSAVNGQLQEALVTERRGKDKTIKSLEGDKEDLAAQVEQLEKTKEELETINDSIQTRLDEQQEKTQDMEEEQVVLKQELEEAQGSCNAVEEELVETQTKLQEIEEVARNLEAALRKRGDSEPPPDLTSLRSLNLSYKAKMTEESLSSSLESATLPRTKHRSRTAPDEKRGADREPSLEVSGLRSKISALEGEREALKQCVEELLSSSAPPQEGPPLKAEAVECLVNEERLKWQVEVAKVRRELEDKMAGERRGWEGREAGLKAGLARMEKEVEEGKSSLQQAGKVQAQLRVSQLRVGQVEGEVGALSERVTELLAEKEKALADLKTIRKTNKIMKLAEEQRSRTSMSSMGSSAEASSPPPPMEEESKRRLGELQALLLAVEKERDDLKLKLEELLSQRSKAPPLPPPAFNFFGKTAAIVGTSGQAVGGQEQAPPTTALRNGWNNSTTVAAVDLPPPKPQKPPKELVDQFGFGSTSLKRQPLSLDEEAGDPPSSIRSRTKSMLQTFFARR